MQKAKFKVYPTSILRSVLIGDLVATAVMLVGAAVVALCISNEIISMSATETAAWALQFLITFTCAVIAGAASKENRAKASAAAVSVFLLLQVIIVMLFCDGVTVTSVARIGVGIAGAIAGIVVMNRSGSGRKNKRKTKSR